jgi:hypothetical integral membrane protein (TIGR02206 family)
VAASGRWRAPAAAVSCENNCASEFAPFALFGPAHLGALAVIAGVTLATGVLAARTAHIDQLRYVLAAILLAFRIVYTLVEHERDHLPWLDLMPLHLCDMGTLLGVYALITRAQLAFELFYFWSLSGTALALITPDIPYDFPYWRFQYYFAFHGLNILAAVFLVTAVGMRPRPRSPLRALLATNVFAAFVYLFNVAFDENYMYLRSKPPASTLFDYFGPWPVYIAVCEVIALVLFLFLDLPFRRSRVKGAPPPLG